MILGYYLKSIAESEPQPLQLQELVPGMPVVAVGDMERLRRVGLSVELRFGIATGQGSVICRRCVGGDIDKPTFCVQELSMEAFVRGAGGLYSCADIAPAQGDVLARARSRVGEHSETLMSYPGDDFVAECLLGISAEKLVQQEMNAGQHWCTPFYITTELLLDQLSQFVASFESEKDDGKDDAGLGTKVIDAISKALPDFVTKIEWLDQTHHGIALEGLQVIHFSSCRLPKDVPLIKTDSIHDFMYWRTGKLDGGAVRYAKETSAQRLLSRNRAVWVFCHADEWKEYSIIRNNCEDFSRYCRVGKKESRQVWLRALQLFLQLGGNLKMLSPYLRLAAKALSAVADKAGKPEFIPYDLILLDYKSTHQKESIYEKIYEN